MKNENYLDIKNLNSIKNLLKGKNISVVINCSCEPATSKSKKKLWHTNVIGNQNLIKACVEFSIKKYIYISTSAIWVKNYKEAVLEEEKYFPRKLWKIKSSSEKDIKNSNLLNWTIFRVPMIVSKERLVF